MIGFVMMRNSELKRALMLCVLVRCHMCACVRVCVYACVYVYVCVCVCVCNPRRPVVAGHGPQAEVGAGGVVGEGATLLDRDVEEMVRGSTLWRFCHGRGGITSIML